VWGKCGAYRVFVVSFREQDHLECLSADGRVILKWVFKKWDREHRLDLSGSGQGQMAGCCECGNEPSVSMKSGKFIDWLTTCWIFKESTLRSYLCAWEEQIFIPTQNFGTFSPKVAIYILQ
jgi:hypothetical protein